MGVCLILGKPRMIYLKYTQNATTTVHIQGLFLYTYLYLFILSYGLESKISVIMNTDRHNVQLYLRT